MSKSQLPVTSSRAVTVERFERNREWLFEIMICCYRVFSLTWPASMQIYWNKRKRLHKKIVQLPEDWFGTPIWPPWRHVKTLYRYAYSWSFVTLSNTSANADITEMKQVKKLRQTGMSASALIYMLPSQINEVPIKKGVTDTYYTTTDKRLYLRGMTYHLEMAVPCPIRRHYNNIFKYYSRAKYIET